MPKGSPLLYGLEGRLLEAVNKRLVNGGNEPVSNLKATILDQKDIQNMVSLLDNEMKVKDTQHQVMSSSELKTFSDGMVLNLNHKRAGNEANMENVAKLGNSQLKGIGNLISEFFNKVKSLFKDNIVTNSIEKSKSMKERLTTLKESTNTEKLQVESGKVDENDYRVGMTPTP